MEIKAFTFSPFAENTYLLYDATKEAVLIDPGCYFDDEKKELSDFITENDLKLTTVLYTHCHLDHAFGSKYISETYKGIEFWGNEAEKIFIDSAKAHAQSFGLQMEQPPALNKYIVEGDCITFGTTELHTICIPGHSPGGLCFYNKEQGDIIPGDILFKGSIGRSDLPGGNQNQLIEGIKKKLLTLPDFVIVYPGHGDYTTIGNEKALNPYLQ
jgi:glyoxylase-like metal-dependent hydrolase (beta-lactamase superfamily II)